MRGLQDVNESSVLRAITTAPTTSPETVIIGVLTAAGVIIVALVGVAAAVIYARHKYQWKLSDLATVNTSPPGVMNMGYGLEGGTESPNPRYHAKRLSSIEETD